MQTIDGLRMQTSTLCFAFGIEFLMCHILVIVFFLIERLCIMCNTCFCAAAKAMAAKQRKPLLQKKILIPQSDQEDSTQDSVSESIINVRHVLSDTQMSFTEYT